MSLGEAFLDIRARTAGFKNDLNRQLKPLLAELQAQVNAASGTGSFGTAATAGQKAALDAARASAAAQIDNIGLVLAAGKAADAELAASAKALAATEKAEAKAVAEAQKAAARDAADEQAAHLKALAAIGRLYRAQASQEATRAAAEAKAINAAALADAKALAAGQRDIAAQLGTSLKLLSQRWAETAAAATSAVKAQEDDLDRLVASVGAAAKRVADAETEAYAIAAEAAKAATDAQDAEFDRWVIASRAAALRVAAAETEAYAVVAAEAKKAADIQIAEDAKVAAARKAAAASQAAFARTSVGDKLAGGLGGIGKSLGSSIAGGLKGLPGDLFGAITTSAKFATVGVLGLGAALAGIGLVSAAKQQAALVGFTALADQISATTDATTGLNVATENLSQDQRKAIGNDFLQQLINITNESAIAQSAIQDTSQQLLALGFNGKQSIGIIRDVGNALAASGKSGGQLNEDLKGVITAFSQIKGSGRLLAQDLNQITTRIPAATRIKVYAELAKELGIAGKTAKATNIQVQKMAKEGLIDADVAIAAITKVLENVPGAAKDAATGLDALGRQNLTLSGRFEALKDNIRSALAKAFLLPGEAGGPGGGLSLSERLSKQLGDFIPVITDAIAKVGPPLAEFLLKFEEFGAKVLPPLVGLIGRIFGALGSALSAISTSLDGVSAKFAAFGDILGRVGFGPALLEALKAIGSAIPPILAALAGITVALTPVLSIVASIARILVAVLGPAIVGAAQALGALGAVLAPVAEALRKVADEIVNVLGTSIAKNILETIGQVVALSAAFIGAAGAVELVITVLPVLIGLLAAMAVEMVLALGPIDLIVIGIAALVVGFTKAWQASETFRDIVVKAMQVVAQAFLAPITLMLLSLKLFLDALAKVAETIGKLPGIPDLSGPIKAAANAVGGLNDQLQAGIGKIGELRNVGVDSTSVLAHNIELVNNAIKGTGLSAISSATDVNELNSIIAALPAETRLKIFVDIGTSNTDFLKSKNIPLTGLEDASGFSTEGINAAAAKARAAANSTADDLIANAKKSFGSIGSGIDSAGKAAADKAKTVATTFHQAMKDIIASLDKDFRDTLVNGTRKQIDTALDSLSKKIAAAFKAAGKARPSGLLNDIAADNVKLKSLADQRDKLLARIKAATDRFNAVSQQIKDFASVGSIDLASIGLAAKDATTKLADLSKLRIILPGQDALNTLIGGTAGTAALKASSQRFADALAARLKQITDFQANVKKLIAEGLNKTTIDQIISQGPENGGQLAASLSTASKATIDQINATQKGIDAAAKSLANTAVDSLFRSGEKVVDGLLAGLTKQDKAIVAAMKHIADVLVAEIKKRLKIASPSRRLAEEVGQHLIPGLLAPVHADGHGLVRDAMSGIANTLAGARLATPAVDVSSLADIAAPKLAPIDFASLGSMARAEANLQLSAALAPSSVQLLAPPPPDAARLTLGRDGVAEIVSALQNARASKEINAPITVHAPAAIADPHATAKVLARAIQGIR